MIRRGSADPLPFFHFGGNGGLPLAIIAGGLILDTGEAERTFIFRCQDRFLSYAALMGVQTVFFAIDEDHVARYRELIARLASSFLEISRRSGLFVDLRIIEPLFLLLDPETLSLSSSRTLSPRLADPVVRSAIAGGIALNQVSPTYAALVAGIAEVMRAEGVCCDWDVDGALRMARTAMQYQDKAHFARWVGANSTDPLAHVPTLLLGLHQLQGFESWSDLAVAFTEGTGVPPSAKFFLKTARNTSGNLSRQLTPANWRAAIGELSAQVALEASDNAPDLARLSAELAAEVAENPALRDTEFDPGVLFRFKQLQSELRHELGFLLQPDLSADHGEAQRAAGIGLSFLIDREAHVETVALAAQTYRDPGRHAFRGSWLAAESAELARPLLAEAQQMCAALAAEGYRGPISFDACLDGDSYRFIHDCNPRLTGVFPSLAVSAALGREGIAPSSVLTLGYRGEFVAGDLDHVLGALRDAGLLLVPGQSRGAVVLPNLCRDDGFDLHLVGISPSEATRLLSPEGALSRIFGAVPGTGPLYI